MAKLYKFHKKDINRFRKVYRYIRKKPIFEFCSDAGFEMVAGYVDFDGSSTTTVTLVYPTGTSFKNVPIVTATSVDYYSDSSANVNVFITSVSATQVQVSVSAPFHGRVHLMIVGQD